MQKEEDGEQERFLPVANISRIMKQALPPNAKISKEAKEQMQECVSEFISFITCEACEKCKLDKRKTIAGDDVLYSLNILGYEKYMDCLNLFVKYYREVMKEHEEVATKEDNN
ncbi:unnamed protein product [Moneuplotes crassus]|uniref:Transcription factor CBF/NF-Y/archaeal histone domain-containing protein n=1 Tax=Euplotes crassus TaxID=5936 RepID=A0AAD1Y6K8_EUPCR|nr:unnamed protein product [Moneuplotes crassus]